MKTLTISKYMTLAGLRTAATLLLAVIAALAALAITNARAGGLVAAWGDNTYGQTTLPIGVNNVKAIAAGPLHNLALKADGTVVGWGNNTYGEANPPSGLAGVTAIAAGEWHSLALRANGTVTAWGSNNYGQTNVPSDLSRVIAIAAGYGHNLALKADGTVVAWGLGSQGQTNTPAGLSNVVAIATGQYDNLALKADGMVVAWGYDFGTGQTNVPSGLSNVVAIATGYYHSLALKSDGTVVAWGSGSYGQTNVPAGLSNVVAVAADTYQSLALKADGTITWWGLDYARINPPVGLSNVTAIAAAGTHGLAIVSDGPIQILQNPQSQEVPYTSNAIFLVTAVGSGPLSYQWFFNGRAVTNSSRVSGATNAALYISNAQFTDTGTYALIVSNIFGSVRSGGATLTVTSAPVVLSAPTNQTLLAGADITLSVDVTGSPPLGYQWMFDGSPISGARTPSLSLTNVQSGQSGVYSLVISNAYGVITNNVLISVADSAPYILIQPTNRTAMLGGSVRVSVTARGTLPLTYQWIWNGTEIPGATDATLTLTSLRLGQAGYYSVLIRNSVGTTASAKAYLSVSQVVVWGGTYSVGSSNYSYGLPEALTNFPPGLTNVVAISAGADYLLALKANGTVAAWGGAATYAVTNYPPWHPIPIGAPAIPPPTNVPPDLNGVVAIAAGASHCLALKSDGTVVAWGDNTYGQTNVPAGLSNVIAVAAGETHSLALKSDSSIVPWGQISLPPMRSTNFPPPVLPNVTAIAAGAAHDMALKSDGKVVYWGATTNFPAGLSNVIAVSFNPGATSSSYPVFWGKSDSYSVLRADGTVVPWSDGNQIFPPDAPPPALSGLSNAVAISGSMNLVRDGTVFIARVADRPPQSVSNVIAIAAGTLSPQGNISSNRYVVSAKAAGAVFAAVVGDGSPFLTLQPAGQAVTNGATVQFHARAVGVQPMRYQWRFNGVNLSDATNGDLTITNVHSVNVGSYQLVVTNVLGSVISKVAQLTIMFSADLAAALNATNFAWITSQTNAPWFAEIAITHDGNVAAQSGHILDDQQTVLQTTGIGPGLLTFWWKVSSEEYFDFLNFYLDQTNSPLARISGDVDWQQLSFNIPSGPHTLWWIYAKDPSVSVGQDAGWLDQVSFTPAPLITQQPQSQTVWMGSNVTFQAVATWGGMASVQWLKNGTNLPGAHSIILTLTNLTRCDSGIYVLQITNAGGSATSSNAWLTVLVPQRLSEPRLMPNGSFDCLSRDADGGGLQPSDLVGFEVRASTNLVDWIPLPGALTLTNGILQLHDPAAASMPMRFYRIIEKQ